MARMRMKRLFADSSFQLALLLSILRTDLTHYFQQYSAYPEVQHVLHGQTIGLHPVDTYRESEHQYQLAKHVNDGDFLYNNLNRLAQPLSNIRQQHIISAWLVTNNTTDSNNRSTSNNSTTTDNNSTEAQPSTSQQQQISPALAELTREEMDLIDILWNQDMDMGVGREMYDPNLRLEMEKERELKQKQKEEQEKRERMERERAEMANFIIDDETGERIPINRNATTAPVSVELPAPPVRIPFPGVNLHQPPEYSSQQSLDTALEELSSLINNTAEPVEPIDMMMNSSEFMQVLEPQQQSNGLIQNTSMVPSHQRSNALMQNTPMVPQQQMNMAFTGFNHSLPVAHTNNSGDFWSSVAPPSYSSNPFTDSLNASNNSTDLSFLRDLLDGAESLGMDMNNLSMSNNATMTSLYPTAPSEDSAVEVGGASSNGTWSDSRSVNSDMFSDIADGASGYSSSYKTNSTDTGFYDFEPFRGNYVNVSHNHTYGAPPGGVPHIRKMDMKVKKEPSRGLSRDEKRCRELKIPFPVSKIICSAIEEFNDVLRQHKLNENQLSLIRDIRRRGKNKAAAQNCRKKKINELGDLEAQLDTLRKKRDALMQDKLTLQKRSNDLNAITNAAYNDVFRSLRDDSGAPYNPSQYSLEISSDGNILVVPTNSTSAANKNNTDNRTARKRRYEQ